jgi:hypothetical protein
MQRARAPSIGFEWYIKIHNMNTIVKKIIKMYLIDAIFYFQ